MLKSASTKSWPCWRSRLSRRHPRSSLNQHISLQTSSRNTRSSSVPPLRMPFWRRSVARRSFSTAAPLTWNSLPPAVLNCDSFSAFKSRFKPHLFATTSFNCSTLPFRQHLCSRLTALGLRRVINFVLFNFYFYSLLFLMRRDTKHGMRSLSRQEKGKKYTQ